MTYGLKAKYSVFIIMYFGYCFFNALVTLAAG